MAAAWLAARLPARAPPQLALPLRDKGSQVVHLASSALEAAGGKAQPDLVRVVCISDTHSELERRRPVETVPLGDILIHAGDFSYRGTEREIDAFIQWFTLLPHPYKIVIAGNHEIFLDPSTMMNRAKNKEELAVSLKDKLRNCQPGRVFYLEDSSCKVMGLTIYGSPWQPEFCGWAFNLRRGAEIRAKWDLIPLGVDILVTHGPPKGHGSLCDSGVDAGCEELLEVIESRVKPLVHVFGHIHEGWGVTANKQGTLFVNASTCTLDYEPDNPPIVLDVKLPLV